MHLPYEHVSLREGLRRGRGHLLFLLGLAVVMALIVALDGIAPSPRQAAPATSPGASTPPQAARDAGLSAPTPLHP